VQSTSGVAANSLTLTITLDSILTINQVTVTPNTGADPASCNAPAPGLGSTNIITCNIASLGGLKAANPPTLMKVTVFFTAPTRPA
jgi:hypothetical protein